MTERKFVLSDIRVRLVHFQVCAFKKPKPDESSQVHFRAFKNEQFHWQPFSRSPSLQLHLPSIQFLTWSHTHSWLEFNTTLSVKTITMENEVSKSWLVADRTEKKITLIAKWGYSLCASHKSSNFCSHAEKRKLITRVKTIMYFSEWFLPPSTQVNHVHSNPVSGWHNSIIGSDISDFQKCESSDLL